MTVGDDIPAASNCPNIFLRCLHTRMGSSPYDHDPEFRPLTLVAECDSLFCYNLFHSESQGWCSHVGSAVERLLQIASRKPVIRSREQ